MKCIAMIMILVVSAPLYAKEATPDFDTKVQHLLNSHYQKYKDLEYFSGATLSIYTPENKIRNYYIGQVAHEKESRKISADTLFQIGSITKSFTAAIILQLEKEGKLHLSDTLKDWLPVYSKWSSTRLDALLNMTSGLPNYSDTPLWNAKAYTQPDYRWSNEELIHFVYPSASFSPPLKPGYFYSNTGYILLDGIVEKITQHDFQTEIVARTINPAGLTNTFYPLPTVDKAILDRMAQGYNYNQYDNPALVGNPVKNNNLSWAGAAGAVVSNSEDIIKWVKALFIDHIVLDNQQKQTLTTLVSTSTGKAIKETSKIDNHGFGLGVAQMYSEDPAIGRFWFYEGQTLGFRAVYIYTPCNGVIISSIFNSATNTENDHTKEIMVNAYKLVIDSNPRLHC